MEWQAAGEAWQAKTDKWQAKVELDPTLGWTYQIAPLDKEEPSCMGNSSTVDNCKAQVARMVEIMNSWK